MSRAGVLAAFEAVAADVAGPNWKAEAIDRLFSWDERRARRRRVLDDLAAARVASQPAQQAAQEERLAWLLSQATVIRGEPIGHDARCARIDAGIARDGLRRPAYLDDLPTGPSHRVEIDPQRPFTAEMYEQLPWAPLPGEATDAG